MKSADGHTLSLFTVGCYATAVAEALQTYELTCIVAGQCDESAALRAIDSVRTLIEQAGGQITAERPWGKRRLEHSIGKETNGYFQTLVCSLPRQAVAGLESALERQPAIIRHLLVQFVKRAPERTVTRKVTEESPVIELPPSETRGAKLEEALEEILKE